LLEASDLELVRSAVGGDDRAFHALVDRHGPALFRSAVALSRNYADAEDLLQETFVAAHRGLKNFAGRASVRTWLLKILTRKAFKALHRSRHRRATLSLDALDGSRTPSDDRLSDGGIASRHGSTATVEHRLDVMQVLKSLSAPHREILVLRDLQGLSYEQIAEVLSVPRGTVESRLFRARAEFRERFTKDD
jgi:RNA polymerase sigma-70 factor (ECF subfamily)